MGVCFQPCKCSSSPYWLCVLVTSSSREFNSQDMYTVWCFLYWNKTSRYIYYHHTSAKECEVLVLVLHTSPDNFPSFCRPRGFWQEIWCPNSHPVVNYLYLSPNPLGYISNILLSECLVCVYVYTVRVLWVCSKSCQSALGCTGSLWGITLTGALL